MKNPRRQPKTRLTLTWFGHSAFLMHTPSGKRVLVDPWLENPKAPPGAKDIPAVDMILVTHGHSDHVGNTIELAHRTGAPVISIYEIAQYFQSAGLTGANGMNKGGTMEIQGINVTMVDAVHSSDIDTGGQVLPGGEAAGFVIEFENGYRVYHAGDTALFSDMKLIGTLYRPHLVLLPIGGLYTMPPRDAAKACQWLKPKRIIGMHYGTFPVLTGTPEELKSYLPVSMRARVVVMTPGTPVSL